MFMLKGSEIKASYLLIMLLRHQVLLITGMCSFQRVRAARRPAARGVSRVLFGGVCKSVSQRAAEAKLALFRSSPCPWGLCRPLAQRWPVSSDVPGLCPRLCHW